jgi:hypothetical protein
MLTRFTEADSEDSKPSRNIQGRRSLSSFQFRNICKYNMAATLLESVSPIHILFSHQIKIVAPGYFDMHEPALEACCHDIDQWPFPTAGQTMAVPVMGCILQVISNLIESFTLTFTANVKPQTKF